MNDEKIKQVALKCGFKLNGEKDGEPDLKEYVYQFAREISLESKAIALSCEIGEINRSFSEDPTWLEYVNEIGKIIEKQRNIYLEKWEELKSKRNQ